jgi:hypothetical protein
MMSAFIGWKNKNTIGWPLIIHQRPEHYALETESRFDFWFGPNRRMKFSSSESLQKFALH